MNINILTIDIKKIDVGLGEYARVFNRTPYVICSDDTANLMIAQCSKNYDCYIYTGNEFKLIENKNVNGTLKQYKGCSILIDNSLKLGEVEIR